MPAPARGHVTGVEITSRSDVLAGKAFGAVGPYEKLSGRVTFAVKPGTPHNRAIVDLERAPLDAAGEVEFSADFYLLKPKDQSRGNGSMWFEPPNRGGKSVLAVFNQAPLALDPVNAADFGDGFLMEQGYTVAWLGWQADGLPYPNALRLHAPVARTAGGGPIFGLVRVDFTPWAPSANWTLGHVITGMVGGLGYPAVLPRDADDIMTVRATAHSARTLIPASDWQFGRQKGDEFLPDAAFVHLAGGFIPGRIYEVVYRAQDPRVVGLGFAAVRDFLSFSKHDPAAPAPVQRVYAYGVSQTGRFLRHFLYQDFNADESGRKVIDGVFAHVAGAGRGSFNYRFAQPSRDAQGMASVDFPTDVFPFGDLPQTDPQTGKTDGLLNAATASQTVPKIFFSNTSHEYWGRSAALIHVSPDGRSDAALSPDVRIYFFAGLQHFPGPFPPAFGPGELRGQEPEDPNPVGWLCRALATDLDAWVRTGARPPDSRYPRLADKTLVARSAFTFPAVPGIGPTPEPLLAFRLDFGPHWNEGLATLEPPHEGPAFPAFVPQVDADGNDLGGVRIPELAVPLATYPGWNLRAPAIGAPAQRVAFLGAYLPFPKTAQERADRRDPRPSVEERYRDREDYLARYEAAALTAIQERFLRAEDLPAILSRGAAEWQVATQTAPSR